MEKLSRGKTTMKISYNITDERKRRLLTADYGADSRISNNTIGKTIIAVCEEGIEIPEDRKTFANQRLKNLVVKRLLNNPRIGKKTKKAATSHYGHQSIMYEIWLMDVAEKMKIENLLL